MKVLTFTLRFVGHKTPTLESHFYDEYLELSKKVNKLIVITPEKKAITNSKIYVWKAFTINKKFLRGLTLILSYIIGVIKHLKEVDLIYIRTLSPPEFVATFIAIILKKPVICRIPGMWVFEPPTAKNVLFKWFFTQVAYRAKFLILYSWRMYPLVRKYLPKMERSKVVVIPNSVDIQRFRPLTEVKEIKNQLDIKEEDKLILYVGRISKQKGIEEIIRAAALVISNYPKVKFILAGNHAPTHMKFRKRMENLVEELRIKDKVIFIGPIINEKLPELINASYISICATHGGEGQTRFLLESMACKVPIISTPVAGNPDFVIDDVTGYLFPVGDYKLLSIKILKLLKDENKRNLMGENCRKLIEKSYELSKNISLLLEVFQKALIVKKQNNI